MTPAQRYDLIINSLVQAAIDLQCWRESDNHYQWLDGQDNLAVAEFHSDQLQKECPRINLHGTIDFDQLL